MVDSTLQHLIYGNAVIANNPTGTADVLAISDAMNPDRASQLIASMPLSPFAVDDIQASQAIAFTSLNGGTESQFVMARVHFQNPDQSLPVHQLVLIPAETLHSGFDLESLLNHIEQPIPTYNVTNAPLEPLVIDLPGSPTGDKKVAIIKSVLDDCFAGNFQTILALLAMAIDSHVVICNFPQNNKERLKLIRGLRLLLPEALRYQLTFTTHTDTLEGNLPRIIFSEVEATEGDHFKRFDWQHQVIDESLYELPYIAHLQTLWNEDVIALVENLKRLDEIAATIETTDKTLNANLTAIAQRHQLDARAIHGETLSSEDILAVFESAVPMSLALKTAYLILLLENYFRDRDSEVALFTAAQMDDNDALDASMVAFLETSIEQQPDAVYAFVRTYLHHIDDDIAEKWLARLHQSAQASVQVAIESGDAGTILSWLKLISREPLRYELSDILYEAMLAAQLYVEDSHDLARELLVVAVKRQPEMIDSLITDERLLANLPESVHAALIEFNSEAIDSLGTESRELFLLAVHHVIQAESRSVTSAIVRNLWQIHIGQQTNNLPPEFRPITLIQGLAEHTECFVNGAAGNLLTLILSDGTQDELFYQIVPLLADGEQFTDSLANAFEQSNRASGEEIDILAALLTGEILESQTVVDVISTLLVNSNWNENNLPLVEQLSRVMTQHPDTVATLGVLWKLAEISGTQKNEQILKVSNRRLLESIGEMPSEEQVVESIQRLRKDSNWSMVGRNVLIKWWRNYAREQGTGQLQKVDKLLDGKRNLEDLRAIVQTSIAMRRIIGQRSLEEFSEAVATTFSLLQALSEGFDASDKLVDSTTIRQEIDSRAEELPVELRPVLSTNLKELAQIVTTLSDNRSKASLIGSDDTVERKLVKGEQDPQSAVDVMRWLSGYLDGVQKDTPDE